MPSRRCCGDSELCTFSDCNFVSFPSPIAALHCSRHVTCQDLVSQFPSSPPPLDTSRHACCYSSLFPSQTPSNHCTQVTNPRCYASLQQLLAGHCFSSTPMPSSLDWDAHDLCHAVVPLMPPMSTAASLFPLTLARRDAPFTVAVTAALAHLLHWRFSQM